MLKKTLSVYFLFRCLTALAGFSQVTLAISQLGTAGYGDFALLFASASLIKVLATEWLAKSLIKYSANSENFSEIFTHSIWLYLAAIFIFIILLLTPYDKAAIISLLAIAEAAKTFISEAFRSKGEAFLFGSYTTAIAVLLATLSLLISTYKLSPTEYCFYWSVITITVSIMAYIYIYVTSKIHLKPKNFFVYLKTGLPLSLSDAISQFSYSGIRFVISYFFGNALLGIYAAIYDLIQRSLVAYMQVINSAIYPIIRKAWNDKDRIKYKKYSNINLMLLIIPTSCCIILTSLAIPLAYRFLSEISNIAHLQLLIFIIGAGVISNRIRTFHYDYAYVFLDRTHIVLRNSIITVISIAMMLVVINDNFYLLGICASVTCGYIIGLILSYLGYQKLLPQEFK